jgi:hypothetical protein
MTPDPSIRDHAKAIREQAETRPAPRNETAREARWRVERERAQRDAAAKPHTRY